MKRLGIILLAVILLITFAGIAGAELKAPYRVKSSAYFGRKSAYIITDEPGLPAKAVQTVQNTFKTLLWEWPKSIIQTVLTPKNS